MSAKPPVSCDHRIVAKGDGYLANPRAVRPRCGPITRDNLQAHFTGSSTVSSVRFTGSPNVSSNGFTGSFAGPFRRFMGSPERLQGHSYRFTGPFTGSSLVYRVIRFEFVNLYSAYPHGIIPRRRASTTSRANRNDQLGSRKRAFAVVLASRKLLGWLMVTPVDSSTATFFGRLRLNGVRSM